MIRRGTLALLSASLARATRKSPHVVETANARRCTPWTALLERAAAGDPSRGAVVLGAPEPAASSGAAAANANATRRARWRQQHCLADVKHCRGGAAIGNTFDLILHAGLIALALNRTLCAHRAGALPIRLLKSPALEAARDPRREAACARATRRRARFAGLDAHPDAKQAVAGTGDESSRGDAAAA